MLARRLIAATALLAVWSVAPAFARELSVMVRNPAHVAAWQTVFFAPFSQATGLTLTSGAWNGGTSDLMQQIKSANAWDLVMLDGEEIAALCSGGQIEKLDWSQLGGRDHYLPLGVSDCGVGATVANEVLAWDRDKLPGPLTWADFWDVTKFPAKRGLRRGVRGNLEIALMADGVQSQDVYKVLSTNEGVDRAFRKLDQLRPYIVWWNTPEDAAHILGSGDVLMTSAPSPTIVNLDRTTHRNFGIQWNDSLYDVLSWAVVKNSPHLREAMNLLYFCGTPAIEARLLDVAAEGGLAKGANDGTPPELAAISPTAPANTQGAVQLDAGFWAANRDKLRARFETWLAH